ncbi:MAG: TIM barrel protein [Sphaerochaetaceae bacterium]|jgi:sugar phosphate isomerase/epimerase|nr:sugar phosphate isomerase/epimerase [Candidatus Cloacimonadota bacterium]
MVPIVASVTPNKTKFGPLLYPGELERGIKELGEFGYDGIELSLRTIQDVDESKLSKMLQDANMKLYSIATGQSFIEDGLSLFHVEKEKRDQTVDRLKTFVDLIDSLGGKAVILGGIRGKIDSSDPESQFAGGADAIESILAYAEQKKVTLLLEAINRYETNLFVTVQSCVEFIKERPSDYLKVLGDAFHMNIEEVSMRGAFDEYADYIGAIHTADSNRLAPGMGHTDFDDLLSNRAAYPNLHYLGVEVLPLPDSTTCAEVAIQTLHKITR